MKPIKLNTINTITARYVSILQFPSSPCQLNPETSKITSRLRLLSLLSPKLHHEIDKTIDAKDKDDNQARIPPPEVLIIKVERAQIIRTSRVLTHLASRAVIRVKQVRRSSHPALVSSQILGARRTGWWIKESHLVRSAVDGLVPGGEDHQAGHEVVERVQVVEPVTVNLSQRKSACQQ